MVIKYCKCGCGKKIEIKPYHKYYGIPDYCAGHNISMTLNTPELLKERSKKWKENNPMKNLIIAKKSALKRKGVKRTKEQRENISIGTKKAMKREEVKKKMKRSKNKEHREKISKSVQKLWQNKEYRGKNTGKNSYLYRNGITLEKHYCIDCNKELKNAYAKRCCKCSNREVRNRPEIRKKHSKVMKKVTKQRWEDGVFDGVFRSPTKPEKKIMKNLEEMGIDYIFQYRPEDYSMTYDFFIPSINLLIEFDGIYWHSLPEVKLRDIEKTKYVNEKGYNLLRFNENNLKYFKESVLKIIKKERGER